MLHNQSENGLLSPEQQGATAAKWEKLPNGREPQADSAPNSGCLSGWELEKIKLNPFLGFHCMSWFYFIKTFHFRRQNPQSWLTPNTHSQHFGSERQWCTNQSRLSTLFKSFTKFNVPAEDRQNDSYLSIINDCFLSAPVLSNTQRGLLHLWRLPRVFKGPVCNI